MFYWNNVEIKAHYHTCHNVTKAHVAVIRCKLQDGDFEDTDGGEH